MYYQFIFLQSHLSFNVRKDIFKRKYHLVLVVQESESRQMLKLFMSSGKQTKLKAYSVKIYHQPQCLHFSNSTESLHLEERDDFANWQNTSFTTGISG